MVGSRGKAESFRSGEPWACISISTPGSPPARIDEENRVGILRLEFKDVEFAGRDGGMTVPQALQVWDFVQKVGPQIEMLLVHCDAGMSRSPAIGAAIWKLYCKEDDAVFFKRLTPNRMVYRTMMEAAGEGTSKAMRPEGL